MRKQIGIIGVDSGLVWIGDPCYILHSDNGIPTELGRTWEEFCDELTKGKMPNTRIEKEFHTGICLSTRDGDGEYPVYANYDEDNKITSITIEF